MSDTDTRPRRFSDLGDWVARVGIPAAIAFILLWQTNVKLDKVVSGIERLTTMVEMREVRR